MAVACIRSNRLDKGIGNELLNVIERHAQPSIRGDDLTQLSKDLLKYQQFVGDFVAGGNEFHIRDALADAYLRWGCFEEASTILVDGMDRGELGPLGQKLVLLQTALLGDTTLFEEAWEKFGAKVGPMLSRVTLAAIARGDVPKGVSEALREIDRMDDIRDAFFYSAFIARVLARNAASYRLTVLAQKVFDAAFQEFLRGGKWDDFVSRFSRERRGYLEAVLFQDLTSIIGSAAEFYSKQGNVGEAQKWLRRLSDLDQVLRTQNSVDAIWVEFLMDHAKK